MDVSIVIVNWNTREILRDCLASIYKETKDIEFEVIVIDNASMDGSPQMVKSEFPRVRLIVNEQNFGFAKANNMGISQSKGRYVCLVNSDVVVRDGCTDFLCAYMDQHPSIGILGPKLLWPDLTLQMSCRRFPTLWNNFCPAAGLTKLFPHTRFFSGGHMSYFPHDRISEVDALVGAFLMVRREAIDQVGLLDDSFFMYSEEIDWCKRFREAGWQIVFFPQAEAIHYGWGSSSQEPTRFLKEFILSNCKFWKKHHGWLKCSLFVAIVLFRHTIRMVCRTVLYVIKPSERKSIRAELRSNLEVITMFFPLSRQNRGT